MLEEYSLVKIRNKHQLQLTDKPLPTVIPKLFKEQSQVSNLLHPKNQTANNPSSLFKKVRNPITQQFNSIRIFQAPDNDNSFRQKLNKASKDHQQWLEANKKFTKPYSQCTKYIDNLSQHHALIRRGPFNVPLKQKITIPKSKTCDTLNTGSDAEIDSRQYTIPSDLSRVKSVSETSNLLPSLEYKSVQRIKKESVFKSLNNLKVYQVENKSKHSKSINLFDRSLSRQGENYDSLMRRERDQIGDMAALRNSLNKLVGMEMVRRKLEESSFESRNNLRKIHQKLKQKGSIKVQPHN